MEKEKEKEFLNVREAAAFLCISIHSIYEMTSQKRIPHYKPGGKRVMFKRSELEEWVKSFQVKVVDQPY